MRALFVPEAAAKPGIVAERPDGLTLITATDLRTAQIDSLAGVRDSFRRRTGRKIDIPDYTVRMFRSEGIDHVALAVRDVPSSARWYAEVLGLERLHEEVWGDFPAIVGNGTTAVALFPVEGEQPGPRPDRATIAMRHLAFRVDRANFTAAKASLSERGIAFTEQHHGIAESIYFLDPDGHELEITTYEL